MSERFDRVLKMSLDYSEIELMDMLDMSLFDMTPFERSIEISIALILNRINEFNRRIDEIKQCLKGNKTELGHMENTDYE